MITPDVDGRLWHSGTKIGLVYGLIALIIFGITTTQDPDGPFAWLSKLSPLLIMAPFAAASHAYVLGRKETDKGRETNNSDSSDKL